MKDENNTGNDEVTTVKDSEQTETESTSAASTDETATDIVAEIGTGLGATEDFTEPERLYEKLIETIRKYRPTTDLTIIERA